MVSCAEILEESKRFEEGLGEAFFRDLGERIHKGMLEIEQQRRERQVRLEEAYARNWNLQVTI